MQKFEVDFYKKIDGECPVEEFLDSLQVLKRLAEGMDMVLKLEFIPKR